MTNLDDHIENYKKYHKGNTQKKLYEEQSAHKLKLYDVGTEHLKRHHGSTDDDHSKLSNLQDIEDFDEREYHARQLVHKLASYGLEEIMGKGDVFFESRDGPVDKTHTPADGEAQKKVKELHVKPGHEEMLDAFMQKYMGVGYENLVRYLRDEEVDLVNGWFDRDSALNQLSDAYAKNLTSVQRNYSHAETQISKLGDRKEKLLEQANPILQKEGLQAKPENFTVQRFMDLLQAHSRGQTQFKKWLEENRNLFKNVPSEN